MVKHGTTTLRHFFRDDSYPESANSADKRTLRRLASHFFLNEEVLYKKSYGGILLRWVDAPKANQLMSEIHKGLCRPHISGFILAWKILRQGYYWLTIENNYFKHVRKCHLCQSTQIKSTRHLLWCIIWLVCGLFLCEAFYVIGLIHLKASNGYRFILVAIDYFTKWVEAALLANLTKTQVPASSENIILWYNLPAYIITANARNLNSDMMDSLCAQFKIDH